MSENGVLSTYDSHQAKMMEELCIQVNEDDSIIGSISKYIAHRGIGILHRAFSVLIFNSENKLLIQQRSMDKITFPGFWANSCCSHPLFDKGETFSGVVDGVARAAIRKIPQELGINTDEFKHNDFNLIGRFQYKATDDTEWIEHEIDYVIGIHNDSEPNININEVMEYKWVSRNELFEFVTNNDNKIAPWFSTIIDIYLKDWWPENSTDYPDYNSIIIKAGVIT
ncbi:MAG: isopentenyl-diphosphate delta-isomerase [Methanobacteriota archaeon]|mgnify:CR=1 FL=1|nr:MAG: isopentenyl-diphosphate delta-isomerase [Euryarchaeota archaeon]|tara:strand:- start:10598 stop:11272 length:675 start_codon:yes stop_codon:yes gene_type:complete